VLGLVLMLVLAVVKTTSEIAHYRFHRNDWGVQCKALANAHVRS
jgi:hypothetical protein